MSIKSEELRIVSAEDKRELAARLARIEGQIRAIREMIEREESCELVAQQLDAARQALNKAFSELIARTIERNCLSGKMADPAARAKLLSMVRILTRYA
ncbi:MAG: metal-sensing transcriptional repressor [Candidatus Bipolaricaulota bacterium]|nr:metal-sensing transcriptional repressor [Candidatus Bipolaricaulota bacterium]